MFRRRFGQQEAHVLRQTPLEYAESLKSGRSLNRDDKNLT